MTNEEREQAIAILENEKKCVNRANKNDYCNRDCYNCELVKTDTEILTALDMAIKALKQEFCEDYISRKVLLDKIKEVCFSREQEWVDFRISQGSNGQRDFIINYIEQLPSVKPQEPKTEKVIKMRDATPAERESIDKYIKSISKSTGVNFDSLSDSQTIHYLTDKVYSELCLLAEKGRETLQTNSGAVSRHAVLETLDDMDNVLDEDRTIENYKELLKECYEVLPPVNPQEKIGYWIRLNDYTDEKDEHKCSNCGFESMGVTRFCPDCGSKMYEDKGVLEQLAEKQNNLSATNKAWSDFIEKNGYVN